MLDNEPTGTAGASSADNTNDDINPATGRPRRRAASRPAGPPPEIPAGSAAASGESAAPARRSRAKKAAASDAPPAPPAEVTTGDEAPAKKTAAKRSRKRADAPVAEDAPSAAVAEVAGDDAPAPRKRKRPARKSAAPEAVESTTDADEAPSNPRTARRRKSAAVADAPEAVTDEDATDEDEAAAGVVPVTFQPPSVIFQEPAAPRTRRRKKAAEVEPDDAEAVEDDEDATAEAASDENATDESDEGAGTDEDGAPRRRRRRGGRGRRGRGGREGGENGDDESTETAESSDDAAESTDEGSSAEAGEEGDEQGEGSTSSRRRRRRRSRGGSGGADGDAGTDDPPNTVVRVREPREPRKRKGGSDRDDEITGLRGSTRIEAKKQRRREGREAGRRRPPVLTESEFLARREAVERVMVIRQTPVRTQIAVLEDDLLVEHHVSGEHSENSGSMVGNVYLGRVQNVLPSMEAAFVDIGRGRNAVLYAGEVNWDAAGLEGQPKRIEHALKSGDPVLVQVTKDPVGQKGARLTSQISLPGRYLVYVPEGSMNGISRKLPDTERSRLKAILKKVVPEQAGVIVRTAAEGATEEELSGDVERLAAQWTDIDTKAKSGSTSAPSLLHGEPDLTTRVVRDIFNEDFTKLVVAGDDAWTMVDEYVGSVAPDLRSRVEKWVDPKDVFVAYRVDEQLLKALDRKVYLPSGGSLVIDRTEAMTVVDVNTGKFTGQGGNLEATVTENNLEAAEEIVRQLRLRDVGGIIVVDFIDMVLESNRDLVLRRLLECLGRDRTKHQVAEVTSLGLVQMTRKRVGAGLLEVFSETCDCCNGRGVKISLDAPKAMTKADKKDAAAKIASMASAGKKDDAEPAEGDEKPKQAKKASRSRKKAAPAADAEATEATDVTDVTEPAATTESAPAPDADEATAPAAEVAETPAEPAEEAPAKAPRARRSRAKKAAAAPSEAPTEGAV